MDQTWLNLLINVCVVWTHLIKRIIVMSILIEVLYYFYFNGSPAYRWNEPLNHAFHAYRLNIPLEQSTESVVPFEKTVKTNRGSHVIWIDPNCHNSKELLRCVNSVFMPRGSWSARQLLMHNICVRPWIGWYVRQPIHDICVIIYVRLCHRSSYAGPPIELSLVTSGLTPRGKQVKQTVLLTRLLYTLKQFIRPSGLFTAVKAETKTKWRPWTSRAPVENFKGLRPYPNIDEFNREKTH